jgi:membrane-bound lytic murein transglycosylase A
MCRPRFPATIFLFLIVPIAAGIVWWLTRPPVAGPLRLTAATFADLPDWLTTDPRTALAAFKRSCDEIMAKAPATRLGAYGGTVAEWRGACGDARTAAAKSARDARRFFEKDFSPFQAAAGDVKDGLFTGYYEPELHGSRTKHGRYQTPVYGLPGDLITIDLAAFPSALSTQRIAGRIDGRKLVPYATRAEIDGKGLAPAPILFYGDDPVAVFFMHVQGSGRVVFDDGKVSRVAYAGQNGWPYTAIGRTLIAQGAMTRDHMSMQAIRDWLRTHPERARKIMESDASFVFFRELPLGDPTLGSPGAEGASLTPGASIAVDMKIHPLGAPFFVATKMPDSMTNLHRLFIAQDTGGAIRGPVRADIFFGFGADAENNAGGMKQTGQLYVLLPKAIAARAAPPAAP